MSDFSLPKGKRIKKSREFSVLYQHGDRLEGRYSFAYWQLNDVNQSRLGLTVSKKVGCAVVRNQIKRYYREAFRLLQHRLVTSVDVVINAKPRAKKADFYELNADLIKQLIEANVCL